MPNLTFLGSEGMNQRQRFEVSLEISDEQLERLTVCELIGFANGDRDEDSREALIDLARWIYDSRRERDRFLGSAMLGEPVWDMLLALYCLPPRGEPLCVSSLCYAAGAPQTTALRWVQLMEQKGLIERSRDPADARRTYVSLSDDGDRMMTALLQNHYSHRPR